MRYAVVIEQEGESFGAYVPDLPGCVAVGESEAEVRQLIREAIVFHLEGLAEEGASYPPARAHVEYVEVAEGA